MTADAFGVAGAPVQQHPVAVQEVLEGVADGVAQLSDVDGVHQAKASELVHAQASVKHLGEDRSPHRSGQGAGSSGGLYQDPLPSAACCHWA